MEMFVYDLTNGETMKGVPVMETVNGRRRQKRGKPNKKYPKGPKLFTQPTLKQIQDLHGEGVTLVAARNRLYYGVNDPAYKKAREAAKKNNKEGQKLFKRVSVKNAFTDKGRKQAKTNMDILPSSAYSNLLDLYLNGAATFIKPLVA